MSTGYKVLRIPTASLRLVELVNKFRDTKLAALEAEPTGFAVNHGEEVLHPQAIWQQRLTTPSTVVICVKLAVQEADNSVLSNEEILLSSEWIGMATIRGSLDYSTFHLPESAQPVPEDPSLETRWHMCNVYTSPAHRGRGIAKLLVNAATKEARAQTSALAGGEKMKARVRLFCDPSKGYLVKIYERMGFEGAGICGLRDAFVANGDEGMIPEDTTSTPELRHKWERRYGLAMEKLL